MQLRPYQERGADFLFATNRAMILAPVGAGKTAMTLTAMSDMVKQKIVKRWLVIAPKRVVTDVWPAEGPKWALNLTMSLVIGTPAKRLQALQARADV